MFVGGTMSVVSDSCIGRVCDADDTFLYYASGGDIVVCDDAFQLRQLVRSSDTQQNDNITALDFCVKTRRFAAAYTSMRVAFFSPVVQFNDHKCTWQQDSILSSPSLITRISWSHQGRYLAVGTATGLSLWTWDAPEQRVSTPTVHHIQESTLPCIQLAFSPDDTQLAVVMEHSRTIQIIDINNHVPIAVLQHPTIVHRITWLLSVDDIYPVLMSESAEGILRWWKNTAPGLYALALSLDLSANAPCHVALYDRSLLHTLIQTRRRHFRQRETSRMAGQLANVFLNRCFSLIHPMFHDHQILFCMSSTALTLYAFSIPKRIENSMHMTLLQTLPIERSPALTDTRFILFFDAQASVKHQSFLSSRTTHCDFQLIHVHTKGHLSMLKGTLDLSTRSPAILLDSHSLCSPYSNILLTGLPSSNCESLVRLDTQPTIPQFTALCDSHHLLLLQQQSSQGSHLEWLVQSSNVSQDRTMYAVCWMASNRRLVTVDSQQLCCYDVHIGKRTAMSLMASVAHKMPLEKDSATQRVVVLNLLVASDAGPAKEKVVVIHVDTGCLLVYDLLSNDSTNDNALPYRWLLCSETVLGSDLIDCGDSQQVPWAIRQWTRTTHDFYAYHQSGDITLYRIDPQGITTVVDRVHLQKSVNAQRVICAMDRRVIQWDARRLSVMDRHRKENESRSDMLVIDSDVTTVTVHLSLWMTVWVILSTATHLYVYIIEENDKNDENDESIPRYRWTRWWMKEMAGITAVHCARPFLENSHSNNTMNQYGELQLWVAQGHHLSLITCQTPQQPRSVLAPTANLPDYHPTVIFALLVSQQTERVHKILVHLYHYLKCAQRQGIAIDTIPSMPIEEWEASSNLSHFGAKTNKNPSSHLGLGLHNFPQSSHGTDVHTAINGKMRKRDKEDQRKEKEEDEDDTASYAGQPLFLTKSHRDYGDLFDDPIIHVASSRETAEAAIDSDSSIDEEEEYQVNQQNVLHENDLISGDHRVSVVAFERVARRVKRLLNRTALPGITAREQLTLVALMDSVLSLESQRDDLDEHGMRYALSWKMHLFRQRIHDDTSDRLSDRDFCWALHSQTQDTLITLLLDPEMSREWTWEDMRASGMVFWLESTEELRRVAEQLAQRQFQQRKDPIDCALLYLALRKKKLLEGLWNLSRTHRERDKTLAFLRHDFSEEAWQRASIANAYALLGKQRHHYAAAFFLLADQLEDAVKVCVRHLQDPALGYLLMRLYDVSGTEAKKWLASAERQMDGETESVWWMHLCAWQRGQHATALDALVCAQRDNGTDVDMSLLMSYLERHALAARHSSLHSSVEMRGREQSSPSVMLSFDRWHAMVSDTVSPADDPLAQCRITLLLIQSLVNTVIGHHRVHSPKSVDLLHNLSVITEMTGSPIELVVAWMTQYCVDHHFYYPLMVYDDTRSGLDTERKGHRSLTRLHVITEHHYRRLLDAFMHPNMDASINASNALRSLWMCLREPLLSDDSTTFSGITTTSDDLCHQMWWWIHHGWMIASMMLRQYALLNEMLLQRGSLLFQQMSMHPMDAATLSSTMDGWMDATASIHPSLNTDDNTAQLLLEVLLLQYAVELLEVINDPARSTTTDAFVQQWIVEPFLDAQQTRLARLQQRLTVCSPTEMADVCHSVNTSPLQLSLLLEKSPACQRLFHDLVNPNAESSSLQSENALPTRTTPRTELLFLGHEEVQDMVCDAQHRWMAVCLNHVVVEVNLDVAASSHPPMKDGELAKMSAQAMKTGVGRHGSPRSWTDRFSRKHSDGALLSPSTPLSHSEDRSSHHRHGSSKRKEHEHDARLFKLGVSSEISSPSESLSDRRLKQSRSYAHFPVVSPTDNLHEITENRDETVDGAIAMATTPVHRRRSHHHHHHSHRHSDRASPLELPHENLAASQLVVSTEEAKQGVVLKRNDSLIEDLRVPRGVPRGIFLWRDDLYLVVYASWCITLCRYQQPRPLCVISIEDAQRRHTTTLLDGEDTLSLASNTLHPSCRTTRIAHAALSMDQRSLVLIDDQHQWSLVTLPTLSETDSVQHVTVQCVIGHGPRGHTLGWMAAQCYPSRVSLLVMAGQDRVVLYDRWRETEVATCQLPQTITCMTVHEDVVYCGGVRGAMTRLRWVENTKGSGDWSVADVHTWIAYDSPVGLHSRHHGDGEEQRENVPVDQIRCEEGRLWTLNREGQVKVWRESDLGLLASYVAFSMPGATAGKHVRGSMSTLKMEKSGDFVYVSGPHGIVLRTLIDG